MTHPYRDLSDEHFRQASVAGRYPHEIDPVTQPSFEIQPSDPVATMGSCFAQHLSQGLSALGMTYFVTESAPDGLDPREGLDRGFGVFSARYGNVYTARQALQLFDRAFGDLEPDERPWRRGERWVDPFRPRVEPGGFASIDEVLEDRAAHLSAVRRVFLESRFLILTLGLTEAWTCRADGAVLPLVPGAAGGAFDPGDYAFVNFGIDEVRHDLTLLMSRIAGVNSELEMILTVSPVPMIATHGDDHVVVANTYSKSLLRVAAHDLAASSPRVHYFPSYEIIVSPSAGNRYYQDDLRSVNAAGVDHVMRVFSRHHLAGRDGADGRFPESGPLPEAEDPGVVCDEEALILPPQPR